MHLMHLLYYELFLHFLIEINLNKHANLSMQM